MIADEKTLDLILRSARSQPMRVLYLRSQESRERLRPALSAVNAEKTMRRRSRKSTAFATAACRAPT